MKGSVWIGCFLVCHQRHLGDWMFPWEELLESANSFDQWFIFFLFANRKKHQFPWWQKMNISFTKLIISVTNVLVAPTLILMQRKQKVLFRILDSEMPVGEVALLTVKVSWISLSDFDWFGESSWSSLSSLFGFFPIVFAQCFYSYPPSD